MSNFAHWAIAHGIHYGKGKYFDKCLIARGNKIEEMLKVWNKSIIWC